MKWLLVYDSKMFSGQLYSFAVICDWTYENQPCEHTKLSLCSITLIVSYWYLHNKMFTFNEEFIGPSKFKVMEYLIRVVMKV